jgi:hypothetical protein
MAKNRILGIVQDGLFRRLTPIRDVGGGCRLTRAKAKDKTKNVDAKAIDLAPYEGAALLIEGRNEDMWVFDVRIVERAGPILSGLVQHVLGGGLSGFDASSEEEI